MAAGQTKKRTGGGISRTVVQWMALPHGEGRRRRGSDLAWRPVFMDNLHIRLQSWHCLAALQ